MTAILRLTMPGVVAEISNISSCVISASELKDGRRAPDKRAKAPSSISAMEFLTLASATQATSSEVCWGRLHCVIPFRARGFRHTSLEAVAVFLAVDSGQKMYGLLNP